MSWLVKSGCSSCRLQCSPGVCSVCANHLGEMSFLGSKGKLEITWTGAIYIKTNIFIFAYIFSIVSLLLPATTLLHVVTGKMSWWAIQSESALILRSLCPGCEGNLDLWKTDNNTVEGWHFILQTRTKEEGHQEAKIKAELYLIHRFHNISETVWLGLYNPSQVSVFL